MGVLDDLRRLSAAEEFFAYLEVPYDPAVVRVARLHILKRMGEYLAAGEADAASDDAAVRARCRDGLQDAYQNFVTRTPIEERVFKVHRDAVAEKPKHSPIFVSLSPLPKKS